MTDFAIVHVANRRTISSWPFPVHQQDLVMIRKNRPDWQAGKLNLPGGHVEEGEEPVQAAARELFEETGLLAKHMPAMGVMYAGEHTIWVFRAVGVSGKPTTKTDEPVELIPFHEIGERGDLVEQNIPIIHGLITNGVTGWDIMHPEWGYKLNIPHLRD